MGQENAFTFRGRREWRDWLSENHDKKNELWLMHYKKHSGIASVTLADAVEEALCFGWIDGKLQSVDKDRYIVRYSPRRPKSVWSKINKDRAERLIESGQMTPSGMARISEARKNGIWYAAYTSRKSEKMPADLEAALKQDDEAWSNFQGFANSYRNTYIGWINDAKTEETRKRRIASVVKRAKQNIKPGIQ
jgi:uncharacterized protein YdeI (YjbR/CyaY-like superfamily)